MMENLKKDKNQKLPTLNLESKSIGTRVLQQVSARYLDSLDEEGPQVVVVGGMKRAVLVDYSQFTLFQQRFQEMFGEVFAISQLLPNVQVPKEYDLKVNKLKEEISGTIQKIVSESPESSPFTDLMDAVLGLAVGVFGESTPAPLEMKKAVRNKLTKTATEVEGTSVRPKRNLTE